MGGVPTANSVSYWVQRRGEEANNVRVGGVPTANNVSY